jgi:hypothetical protein
MRRSRSSSRPDVVPLDAFSCHALAPFSLRGPARKGHSSVGYFIFSLFYFPLALILACVVKDRRGLYVSGQNSTSV